VTVDRPSLGHLPAGPPAPADGFTHAWQLGRRRRRRTAALSTVPVVVAAIVAATLVPTHASSQRGLDTVNGGITDNHGGPHSTSANQVRPGAGTQTLEAGPGQPLTPAPGTNGFAMSRHSGAQGLASATPSPRPRTAAPQNGTLVVTGRAASFGTFTLRQSALLRFDQMSTQGGQSYVGIYLRRTDAAGEVGLVYFPQLNQAGLSKFQMQWGSLKSEVPAGRYVVYLVADSAATVSIPIQTDGSSDAPHLSVHATKPASLAVHVQQAPLPLQETNASLRSAAAFDSGTAGAVGAYFASQSNLSNVNVSACLTLPKKACASGDPQAHGSTAIAVGGYVGATIDVTPGRIKDSRDQLGSVSAPPTTSGTLFLISVAVRVR
jgi:hypothetical protein